MGSYKWSPACWALTRAIAEGSGEGGVAAAHHGTVAAVRSLHSRLQLNRENGRRISNYFLLMRGSGSQGFVWNEGL